MPERRERFMWLYAKQPDPSVARAIEQANLTFAEQCAACTVECISCVPQGAGTNMMWLFRVHNARDRQKAVDFSRSFNSHIEGLRRQLRLSQGQLKRQVNLPTPLVRATAREWPKIDLGLHVVNDEFNGSLTTFIYHEGRFYQPAHLDSGQLTRIARRVAETWAQLMCSCHAPECPHCDGQGCYHCVNDACERCEGTGWAAFRAWASGGFQIDYSTKYPMARV